MRKAMKRAKGKYPDLQTKLWSQAEPLLQHARNQHQGIEDKSVEGPAFRLSTRKSTIQGAGNGLFADGHIPMGTLIGLYPGVLYTASHVRADGVPWKWDSKVGADGSDFNYWLASRGPDAAWIDADLQAYQHFTNPDPIPKGDIQKMVDLYNEVAAREVARRKAIAAKTLRGLPAWLMEPPAPTWCGRVLSSLPYKHIAWDEAFRNFNADPQLLHHLASKLCARVPHNYTMTAAINHSRNYNVLRVPLDIPLDVDGSLLPYIPNLRAFGSEKLIHPKFKQSTAVFSPNRRFGSLPVPDNEPCIMRCLALLTSADVLSGSELLCSYLWHEDNKAYPAPTWSSCVEAGWDPSQFNYEVETDESIIPNIGTAQQRAAIKEEKEQAQKAKEEAKKFKESQKGLDE
eukprot:TRINITY_DN103426_c0_g1_i1.p1 TRINITY_DN103426_c0_g1~~TRINITY_DN103426_c0_g1_i1.p1  ORF type:complete len:455 (+),score=13.05 TRINITY_DN103426_c0_g1_i1:165-1367(+)